MWLTPLLNQQGGDSVTNPDPKPVRKPLFTMARKRGLIGWAFLSVASGMIILTSFYPIAGAVNLALQTGAGARMTYADPLWFNFQRLLIDPQLRQVISNTFLFLIVQVPIMILLGLVLAYMLNDQTLKLRGVFRTAIFLPCAVGLVAYSLIFRQMFSTNGLINSMLAGLGILEAGYNWLNVPWSARLVIILAITWRWTGYNMMFYLAGMQQIDRSVYEAARIDGANVIKQFFKITLPLLRPMILLTAIMSTVGTLQLFDEPFTITEGRPGIATRTIAHHVFNVGYQQAPNLTYASAIALLIFVLAAILGLIQLKVGDKRW